MVTQISDLIVPEVYHPYMLERIARRSWMWNSGIVVDDQVLSQKVAGGGDTFSLPFAQPIAQTDANVGSDDPSDVATAQTLTADRQIARRFTRNQGWGVADLSDIMAGTDMIRDVVDATGLDLYWGNELQKILTAQANSIYLADDAGSGEMVFKAGAAGSGAALPIAAGDKAGPAAIAGAQLTMGDSAFRFEGMLTHPVVAAGLRVQNLMLQKDISGNVNASDAPLSQQRFEYSPYLGMNVISDDNAITFADGPRTAYVSILYGRGAWRFGSAPRKNALTSNYEDAQGEGDGVEEIWSRMQGCLHPYGYKDQITPAGASPTNAEFGASGAYAPVMQRKNRLFAFLITNG